MTSEASIEALVSKRIDERLRTCSTPHDVALALRDLIVGSDPLSSYCTKSLGVAAGLLAVVDAQMDLYRTLQSAALQRSIATRPDSLLPVVDFPKIELRMPKTGDVVPAGTLDCLFFLFRQERSLRLDAPESFNHTSHLGRNGSPVGSQQAALHELLPDLLLYVCRPEMAVYLLVWRSLLRMAQRADLRTAISNPFVMEGVPTRVNIFESSIWEIEHANSRYTLPEARLASQINSLAEDAEGRELLKPFCTRDFPALIHSLDSATTRVADDLQQDLTAIGLLDGDGSITAEFDAMLRYAVAALNATPGGDSVPSAVADFVLLRSAEPTQKACYADLVSNGLMFEVWRISLKFVVGCSQINGASQRLLQHSDLSIGEAFSHLHSGERFMVVPYFYQCALAGTLMEHVVIGLWRSALYPYRHRDAQQWFRVHGIVGLHNGEANETVDRTADRIQKIRRFMRVVSEPVVDIGFYGSVVTMLEFKRGEGAARQLLGHKVKRVANALTDPWVIPAADIIDFGEVSSTEDPRNKIGTLTLDEDLSQFSKTLGIAPYRDVLVVLQKALKLWSMAPSVDDLPLDRAARDQGHIDLKSFLESCLRFTRLALLPFALGGKSIHDASDFRKFTRLRFLLDDLLEHQRISLFIEGASLPRLGTTHRNARDTLWMYRLFSAVFQNCVQHGDVLQPITVRASEVGKGGYGFVISNPPRLLKPSALQDQIMRHFGSDPAMSDTTQEEVDAVTVALLALKASVPFVVVTTEAEIHTGDVLRTCLAELDGALIRMPSGENVRTGPAITEFICKYQMREVGVQPLPSSGSGGARWM